MTHVGLRSQTLNLNFYYNIFHLRGNPKRYGFGTGKRLLCGASFYELIAKARASAPKKNNTIEEKAMKRRNGLIAGCVIAVLLVLASMPAAQAAFYQNSYYRFYYSTARSGAIAKALSLSYYYGAVPFRQAKSVIGQTGIAGKFAKYGGRIPVLINAVAYRSQTGAEYVYRGNVRVLTSQYLTISHYAGVNARVLTVYGRTLARLTSQMFFTNATRLYNNRLFWLNKKIDPVAEHFQGNYRFLRDSIAWYTELSVYVKGPRWGYQQIRAALSQEFPYLNASNIWWAAQEGRSSVAQLSVGFMMRPRIRQFVPALYYSRLWTVYGETPCQMAPGRAPFSYAVLATYGVQYGDYGSWQNIPGFLSYDHKIYWGLNPY